MNLSYFVCVVVIDSWFVAVVLWRQVSEVLLWSSGWSLGCDFPVERWCVL